MNESQQLIDLRQAVREGIEQEIEAHGLVILPPADVEDTLNLIDQLEFTVNTTILDPWYNKGFGGEMENYHDFLLQLLQKSAAFSDHVYLWGFPEILAPIVEHIPDALKLTAWLTWYYKNNPSVIRGWRSSQQTCLHLSQPKAELYPEHFLNAAQKKRLEEGRLRYLPGPPSVIEASLLVGFVGRNEQTGHKAQKPVTVFRRILRMTTKAGHLILDPMSGSGTTGVVARELKAGAILCDISEKYTRIIEQRLGIQRLDLPDQIQELVPNRKPPIIEDDLDIDEPTMNGETKDASEQVFPVSTQDLQLNMFESKL